MSLNFSSRQFLKAQEFYFLSLFLSLSPLPLSLSLLSSLSPLLSLSPLSLSLPLLSSPLSPPLPLSLLFSPLSSLSSLLLSLLPLSSLLRVSRLSSSLSSLSLSLRIELFDRETLASSWTWCRLCLGEVYWPSKNELTSFCLLPALNTTQSNINTP